MQNSVLWAEDLEGHRQPSLYYLSDEEGADGPHLICDWNGSPADFSETEFDTLAFFKEHQDAIDTSPACENTNERTACYTNPITTNPTTTTTTTNINPHTSDDDFIDYPNPAANITGVAGQNGDCSGQPAYRQNDLDFAECAHLDFLSVPPMTAGLIKRFVNHLLDLKSKYPNKKQIKKETPITTIGD